MSESKMWLFLVFVILVPIPCSGQNTSDLRALLSAIDRPVTVLDLTRYEASLDDLLALAKSPNETLYLRARAIAAIGQLGDPNSFNALLQLWDNTLKPGLELEIVYAIHTIQPRLDHWRLTSLLESRLAVSSPPVFFAITRLLDLDTP